MFNSKLKYVFFVISFLIISYAALSIISSIATFTVSSEESYLHPGDVGLMFEEIEINSENGTISSWWIPESKDGKTILMLHGLRSQKSDELILEFMAEFHNLGFSVIAIDFRNHGKSSKGDFTFGLDEVNDVYLTLNYYREMKDVRSVGIWGFSYGATAAVFTGLKHGLTGSGTEIVGIFSDTPYFSLTDMISTQIDRRTPLNLFMADLLKPGILLFTHLFYNFDFNSIENEYRSHSEIEIPTKIIGCVGDLTVPLEQTISVDRSLGMNSSLVVFDKCNFHGGAFSSDPARYIQEFKKHFMDSF